MAARKKTTLAKAGASLSKALRDFEDSVASMLKSAPKKATAKKAKKTAKKAKPAKKTKSKKR